MATEAGQPGVLPLPHTPVHSRPWPESVCTLIHTRFTSRLLRPSLASAEETQALHSLGDRTEGEEPRMALGFSSSSLMLLSPQLHRAPVLATYQPRGAAAPQPHFPLGSCAPHPHPRSPGPIGSSAGPHPLPAFRGPDPHRRWSACMSGVS